MNRKQAFTLIELLIIISILALTLVSITSYLGNDFNTEPSVQLNYQKPSKEMEQIVNTLVDEIFIQGNLELIDDIFSEDYKGFQNPLLLETIYDLDVFKQTLKEVHQNNIFYHPKLLKIEYYGENFQCNWANGVQEYGIPFSKEEKINAIGVTTFKVNNGKIIKSAFGNINFNAPNDFLYGDVKKID